MQYCIIAVISAYLIGSINFAVIFTKLFAKTDVRNYGSGNAGTTNVLRVAGILPGLLTFLFDGLKGYLSSYIGSVLFSLCMTDNGNFALIGAFAGGIACVIGHSYPLFFGFKGGKCAATSVGIFFYCCPIAIAIGLTVFFVSVLLTGIVSLSTLVATVVTVIISSIKNANSPLIIGLGIVIGIIIFLRHSENIKRLIKGTEKRLKIKK